MNDKKMYDQVSEIVLDVMKSQRLFIGQWHLGSVDEIVSPTKLKVYVDGSEISQLVSCNPDVTFSVGNQVWVIFINGNPRDKFVISRRAI